VGVITVLDPAVADQIAAGEVVERPASVVKELVENALDAGATHLVVDVVEGGVERLVVADDGCGMDKDDAVLCFSRHATSKLKSADDLHVLRSFGFRGEALAAIASVAKVVLTTRRAESDVGHAVTAVGGAIVSVHAAGAATGTRVDVKDLFFNVPARRKFLKTLRTEASHIEDVLLNVGLCRPDVAIRLTVDGKLRLDLPKELNVALDAPGRVDRVVRCLGAHLRPYLYPISGQTELLTLTGYVTAPVETRRDLAGIHLSVNGRPVADRNLVQAVRAAFRTLLEVGRQPIVALDIGVDPALVDINVHPRKAEVRFADPRRISGHLISLLSEFLLTTPWLNRPAQHTTLFRLRDHQAGLKKSADDVVTGDIVTGDAPPVADELRDAHRARISEALRRFQTPTAKTTTLTSSPSSLSAVTTSSPTSPTLPSMTSLPGRGGATSFSALRVVGQVGGTYLILEGPDGMVVIDQHAAHERVVFERLRARRHTQTQPSQPLLLPITIELSAHERTAVDDDAVRAELLAFGLDVEGFSPTAAIVRALPPGLDGKKAQTIVRDALAEVDGVGASTDNAALNDRVDAICARLACHAAVRAGDVMAPAAVRALLVDLDAIDLGAHCPHGRPVVRTLEYSELSEWFDR
jgi:DNA mismatch repair protein MutL